MAIHHSRRKLPPAGNESNHAGSRANARISDSSADSLPCPLESRPSEQQNRQFPDVALLDEILSRFSDALALVETVHGALGKAQEEESPIGPEVLTLRRGIEELKGIYMEFDLNLAVLRRPHE